MVFQLDLINEVGHYRITSMAHQSQAVVFLHAASLAHL